MQGERLDPLISVVIPVYNVEKYLEKCLDSVLAQTYGNYEAILVDDGSTDSSGEICDRYAGKDSRVVVYHKPNGGLSDARNYGVERAKGDLVSFIDSDDYITADYLAYLWHLMVKFGCDISSASYARVSAGKGAAFKNDRITEVKLDTGRALERICCTSFGACAKLYKKAVLLQNPFPAGRLYEDIAAVYKLIAACGYVAFSDKPVYVWIQREGSITNSGISERQLDIFWALDGLYEYMMAKYPAYQSAASYRYMVETVDFLSRVFEHSAGKEQKKHFQLAREKALPHIGLARKRDEASLRFKMACLGIYCGYLPYKMLFKLRKMQKHLESY